MAMQASSINGQNGPHKGLDSQLKEPGIPTAKDPAELVIAECTTVTSAMRKNPRWAQSSVSAILGRGGSLSSGGVPKLSRFPERSIPSQKAPGKAKALSHGGKKGKSMQDNPLMSAFARLKDELRELQQSSSSFTAIRSFDVPSLLHPFLQVVRSSSTSAPITSLALNAIIKIFAYKFIVKSSPRLSEGMQLLSAAITHCRFEASDSAADETVLLRILRLMEGMLSGPGGELLGDESICEMMETSLSMCCQIKLSELVRRSAEMSMVAMCQVIFERLKYLETEATEDLDAFDANGKDGTAILKMDPSVGGTTVGSPQQRIGDLLAPPRLERAEEEAQNKPVEARSLPMPERPAQDMETVPTLPANTSSVNLHRESNNVDDEPISIKPYSLPSIRELFRVLVDLLQPQNRQHADALRVMALRIIDVALEVAGPSIAKHPSLATLAKDDLCRHLFQLVRSEHVGILNQSLRVAGTLLATCRNVLKLQQELYLSYLIGCLHSRVPIPNEPGIDPTLYEGVPQVPKLVKPPASQPSSGRSTPVPVKDRQKLGMEGGSRKPDAREAMVESIGALSRIPSYLVELFVNYDCEVDRGDLCEDLIGLLSRNAFPDSATWSTTNVPPLCLDSLLGYIQFLADRIDDKPVYEGFPDRNRLREKRALKKIIIRGATKFNESPKSGIAFLAFHGIIDDPENPYSVTKFLRGTTRISKTVLGEYLSKKSHEHLLEAFLDLFDFSNKRVDEALRDMLNSFRLPGESPLIERIVTVFSKKYCDAAEEVANNDAVYILTYAIIMLNTDQHNPSLKNDKRMTYNDFAKNLRGVNDGKDFPPEYLQEIYHSIKHNEIILPDEHSNQKAFDYAWDNLMIKAKTAGDLTICTTNIFDADMFSATWKPVIATLSYVFMSATDDVVFDRVILGFHQCAQVAARYDLSDALDHIVYCLSSISTLCDTPANTALNTEVQVGGKSVMVSELAVKFGRDNRAQLASLVLFKLIAGNQAKLKDGWRHIVRIWLNLFVNSLIPPSIPLAQKILDITPIPLQNPSHIVDRGERNGESGLFQSFTSYISSYAADDPPEPSEEELDSTLITVDCVEACRFDDVFSDLLTIPASALKPLVQALLAQIPEESSPVVIVVKPDRPPSGSSRPNRDRSNASAAIYDPSVVFILELATTLALRDQESTAAVGQLVADALQRVVRASSKVHSLVVSRAVFYLLHLLNASQEHSFIRAPVVLHTISSFDQPTLEKSAFQILKGLTSCIKQTGPLRNEITTTQDFWSILQGLHELSEGAAGVFDLLSNVIVDDPPAVTADNYEAIVALVNSFASKGSLGPVIEQRRGDSNPRGPKVGKPATPSDDEVVSRGIKAIAMINKMTNRVPALIKQSHLERKKAWMTYWLPIFQALREQCLNPRREIRLQSFSCLQRSLLSPELASKDHLEWTAIFGEVLFPLLARLLKPEVYQTDPIGMGETRVQAATLLCKIFLNYLVALSEWHGMLDLWIRILDIMDRLMNSGQGDSLQEAVPESLKNILLVMSSGGYLVPPAEDPAQRELWDETWKRVDRFLPELRKEIFPEAMAAPAQVTPEKRSQEQRLEGKRTSESEQQRSPMKPTGQGANAVEQEEEPIEQEVESTKLEKGETTP